MKQYEYRTQQVAGTEIVAFSLELDEFGRDGWQVVAYIPPANPSGDATVLLMREVGWRRMRAA